MNCRRIFSFLLKVKRESYFNFADKLRFVLYKNDYIWIPSTIIVSTLPEFRDLK